MEMLNRTATVLILAMALAMFALVAMATAETKPATDQVELHWRLFEQRRRAMRDRMRRERSKDDSLIGTDDADEEGTQEDVRPAARQP